MTQFIKSLGTTRKLKMNLQYFADGEGGQEGGTDESGEQVVFANKSEFDSEVDKKLAKALETAQSKWEKDAQTRIDAAKTEAERLAKMSSEDRITEEQRRKEQEESERLADITRRELRLEAVEELTERKLPTGLVKAVTLTDAEACKQSIDAIEKAFREAVENGVNDRLSASAEIPGSSGGSSSQKGELGKRLASKNKAKVNQNNPYFKN